MAIYFYSSNDTSAPVLSGTAGTLINVLDACLVNGYGSKSPIGQTKEYSATNMATYRMPVGTSRMYMAVDDTGTTVVRQRGFQDVTAAGLNVLLGTNPFPNELSMSGGCYFSKSATANTTARPWYLISNGKIFYFAVDVNSDAFGTSRWQCFGDMSSYNPYDTNSCILIGQDSNTYNPFGSMCYNSTTLSNHYFAKGYDGIRTSTQMGKIGLSGYNGGQVGTRVMGGSSIQSIQYPNPTTGEILLSPVVVFEVPSSNVCVPRGRLPGIWSPCHRMPFITGDTFDGEIGTSLEGKSFFCIRQYSYISANYYGVTAVEISDTWDSPHFR